MINRIVVLLGFALIAFPSSLVRADKIVSLHMSWSLDSKSGAWTNDDVKVSFPEARATFTRERAEPVRKDGTAIFSYSGKRGVITFYLGHRMFEGYPNAAALRDGYLSNMHKQYGRVDMEQSFGLSFHRGNNRFSGVGTTCHFVSFPAMEKMPAYSEIGAVLVGNFLLYYRASFIEKAGLNDLSHFLKATGIDKR